MGIGSGDDLDKMLVHKYQDELTVNPDIVVEPPRESCYKCDCYEPAPV